jgi:hypothetical protein
MAVTGGRLDPNIVPNSDLVGERAKQKNTAPILALALVFFRTFFRENGGEFVSRCINTYGF